MKFCIFKKNPCDDKNLGESFNREGLSENVYFNFLTCNASSSNLKPVQIENFF